MIVGYVELSGESPALARAEAIGAAEALGGGPAPAGTTAFPGLFPVLLPERKAVRSLARRLALARRCLTVVRAGEAAVAAASLEGEGGLRAVFRRVGSSEGSSDASVREAGRAYGTAGGAIDLEQPERRYWIANGADGGTTLLLEAAAVDRKEMSERAMPRLPFQRPISLPTRLARAAANLARVHAGDRVVDPFLGTGALLAESGLLWARVYGIDRDPGMVRGALRNFSYLGVEASEIVEGDAGDVEFRSPDAMFDALLTDPPYGRASATGGEEARSVWQRVVPRWAERVVPGGWVVVVVPPVFEPLGAPWRETLMVPVRVHRSLTRQFRVYRRSD
jgi:putative methyltransferase (TIGR01177 family)